MFRGGVRGAGRKNKRRKVQRKQRDKGRKIVKYKETPTWSVEKHSEQPKQMYSNTLFDTCSLRTLLLSLPRATT